VDLGLTGRRALVLGSSSGLGAAIADALRREGAIVVTHGRRPDACDVAGDLTDDGVPERVVDEAVERLGGSLDILVVNTGGGRPGPVLDGATNDDDAGYRSMLRPALGVARRAVPHLRARADDGGPGRLVFMTARSVLEASPDLARSSVFRSGVAAAARSLALELAPDVLVNVVVPGQFPTPGYARFEAWCSDHDGIDVDEVRRRHEAAIPLRRLGRPDELADVVTFLCSARASYDTGSVNRADGGAVWGFGRRRRRPPAATSRGTRRSRGRCGRPRGVPQRTRPPHR
jgi:NAD(P)-dependent dehydrogenase (short-subunit alcohol dehydrogenase family)